jgi:hypothetical protein
MHAEADRMTHRTGRIAARILGPALVLLLVLPASAAAQDFTQPPGTGPITATLPLLGSSLTVDVSVDDGGNLSSVALDPVGDYTAKVLRPHAVQFVNADGSVKVTILSWGGSSSIQASAGSLADISGTGTWSADVFKTGTPTKVTYTVGDNGSGAPTLTIDSVDAPAAIQATIGDVKTKTSDHGSFARAKIEFAWHGFTKTLSIGAAVSTGHDDQTRARLSISLGARQVQKLTGAAADVLGSHSWSGTLCDGTAVKLDFQVVDDGSGNLSVTYDPNTFATGAAAHAKDLRKAEGFVAFFDKKWAAVLVWLKHKDDGSYDLVVGSFIGKWCKGTEIANPTVNTPVDPDATKGWWGKGWFGWWNFGHGHGGWGWGGWHHRGGGGDHGFGGDKGETKA